MRRQTFSQNLNRLDGDDTPITVEYQIMDKGCRASRDDPGWAMEIEIVNAYLTDTGEVAALSDEETEYFHNWIIDNHVDDGPDPDDAREARRERF